MKPLAVSLEVVGDETLLARRGEQGEYIATEQDVRRSVLPLLALEGPDVFDAVRGGDGLERVRQVPHCVCDVIDFIHRGMPMRTSLIFV